MNHDGRSDDDLAREAEQARSRLVHAVEQLGQRRDDASDMREEMRRHGRQIAIVAGALLLVTVGTMTAILVWAARTEASRPGRLLVQLVWRQPGRRAHRPAVGAATMPPLGS